MSVSRPARCLLSGPSIPPGRPRLRCRSFHSSPYLCNRRRPRHANIKASDTELIKPQRPAKELFKPYTKEERAALAKRYTPAQMEVVEAGEKVIKAEDLDKQGVIRTDPGGLPYLDDLSIVQGVIDKKPEVDEPIDPNARLMTPEEYSLSLDLYLQRFEKYNEGLKYDDPDYSKKVRPNRRDVMEAISEAPRFIGANGPLKGHDMRAPSVPKYTSGLVDEPIIKIRDIEEDLADERDPEGVYDQLRKQTGYSLSDILGFKTKLLVQHRVVNQTRLGKIASMYMLAIAGDGRGRLGLGQAKGQEAANTMNLAKISAIKNMRPIPRYEDRTIFGDVKAKVSAVEVELMARPPGFGLRCQHLIFEMARAAGIQDLAARVPRSRNKMNTVKAAYQALTSQRIPDEIARGRGLKMVDVRKVYYGGRV